MNYIDRVFVMGLKYFIFIFVMFAGVVTLEADVLVNFRQTPIGEVVRFVAKQTHVNILMSGKLTGTVDFLSETPMDEKELLPLLREILRNRGYTIIQKGNYYVVTRAANAKRMTVSSRKESGMVTRVIPVRFVKGRGRYRGFCRGRLLW